MQSKKFNFSFELVDKLKAVMADVATLAIEKEELIEYLALAMLARMNIFLLGLPGNNKSDTIRNLVNRIDGAKHFEAQLHEQFNAEELFGVLDITELAKGNKRIDTSNMLPEADVVVLEETFKARSVLNSLLKAMNEREYTNYGMTYDIPAFTFIGASNEIPDTRDPEERVFAALIDRFEIKVKVDYITGKSNREKALNVVMQRKREKLLNKNLMVNATIPKSELEKMQKELLFVEVPTPIKELLEKILINLRAKGIHVTDRRYLNCTTLLQAVAYLNKRNAVAIEDLAYLKNYFWDMPSDIPMVQEIIEQNIKNPMKESIDATMAIARDLYNHNVETINKGLEEREKMVLCKKFRKEIVRIYDIMLGYDKNIRSDSDRELYIKSIDELEELNMKINSALGFSQLPLKETKMMMDR
ncbi:MAG TPA: AAA family ATPase [Clostridiales bacterium]|nr:AAA family ATPase [Clostridiales bacterium]